MAEDTLTQSIEQKAGVGTTPPTLTEGTQLSEQVQKIDTSATSGTIIPEAEQLGTLQATAQQVPVEGLDVPLPTRTAAAKYTAYVADGTPEAVAAEGRPSAEALVGDIQGTVSERSIAQAATGELDPRATTQYQLGELFKSFEEGKEPPAWASPAMRTVTAMMQARGLGSSSMASAAMTQAIMEAGIPIAKADADKYSQIQILNLTNQQQTALQNAMTFAAMDRANLDARMTAAVNNAQAFLNLDLKTLDNKQKTEEINLQAHLQKMLSDQAAENAARSFNAQSQAQVDQFFAQLDSSIQAANVNRRAAQAQFNISEANAMAQYNADLANQREQFNINMQTQIDQSNAAWRRQANTADTAAANEAARIDAQNLFNMTEQAQNLLWNAYRDDVQWALTTSENAAQRNHDIAQLAMSLEAEFDYLNNQQEYDTASTIGAWGYDLLFDSDTAIGQWIRNLGSKEKPKGP
jgi:hypothetical protein